MARSSIEYSGAASEPARSSSARLPASAGLRPVIWNWLENTPRIAASLITCSSVTSTSTFWPSRSIWRRTFSMNTTAIGRLRFCCVVLSISAAPRASSFTLTRGPSWPMSLVASVS